MATGANIQQGRGNQVTSLPPQVDLRTGDAEAWDRVRRIGDQFQDAAKPDLIRRAQARGAEEGAAVAAGEAEMPKRGWLFGGDVAAARTQALESAYTARVRTDIDRREDELRREFRNDPEGYERAAGEMVSGFIQGAPPEFAVDVETYARSRRENGLSVVANARAARDEQETVQALGVRASELQERLIALGSRAGGMESAEYQEALLEYGDLQDVRANNPAVLYSEDQRVADDDKLFDSVQSANVTRLAIEQYTAAGGGLAGNAAATRFLRDEVLGGEAFSDMDPGRLQRVYRDSVSQVRDFSAADREQQRLVDEQERERNAARREAVGDYRLRILLGEVDRDAIMNDELLQGGDRAGLLASVQAAERRAAADAARDRQLDAAESRAAYNDFRDRADGTLTAADIADGVNAGLISRGQARTLQGVNDRAIRPVIDNVLAPLEDSLRGRNRRDAGEIRARAEENAVVWARNNPDAPLDLQLSVGRDIAARHLGSQGAGQPQGANAEAAARAARVAAANQRIAAARAAGRPMSLAEENRIRNEARNGD